MTSFEFSEVCNLISAGFLKGNIKRHIISMHRDEEDVKSFMMLSDKDPKKKEVLAQIRRDGNFLAFKEDTIVPSRILRHLKPNKTDYIACPCKILLKKDSLRRHLQQSCTKNLLKTTNGMLLRSKAISAAIHERAKDEGISVSGFERRPSERFDSLFIVHANEMACKYRPQHHFAIRNRLIRMAKVLIMMKANNPSLESFKDMMRSQMFDNIVEYINDI
ncbi:hypothetical protein JTB14_010025 [Gonioctena quinquepunctata]|nr:hypothetical protein JTB14_010025 [Gonioctena quinquepunctata]